MDRITPPFASKTSKKVVMERLRRGLSVVNFWLVNFWLSKWSGYTLIGPPVWFLSTFCTFCCVYIMAALTQDISVVQTELEIRLFSKSPLLARAERHHQDSVENLCRVEVWTLTSFRLCWSFDYTPTRSLVFWWLLRDASWIDAMKFSKTEIYQAEFHTICCRFCALSSEHKGPVVAGAGRGSAAGTSVPSLSQISRPSFEVTPVQEGQEPLIENWQQKKYVESLSPTPPNPQADTNIAYTTKTDTVIPVPTGMKRW